MMLVPVIPESAPFSSAQRAWLNGFFAGMFGIDRNGAAGAPTNGTASQAHESAIAAPAAPESFPWHDPALPMDERLTLAEGNRRSEQSS